MTKCNQCNGSGVVHEYDDYDRMSTFRCPACDGAGENMTNFDRIMANMTIEQMAELFVRDETSQDYPDDIPYDSYTTEHTPGYYCFRDDAIKAEIEWLKKEDDA